MRSKTKHEVLCPVWYRFLKDRKREPFFEFKTLESKMSFFIYLHVNKLIGFRWHFKGLQISFIYWNQDTTIRENWWQKVLIPPSYGFLLLRISENLWWSSLKSIFRKITFSVGSSTMIFMFVVRIVVLFKINRNFPNLKYAGLLIWWNKNNIAGRKWSTKFYVLFHIGSVWNKNLVLNWRL